MIQKSTLIVVLIALLTGVSVFGIAKVGAQEKPQAAPAAAVPPQAATQAPAAPVEKPATPVAEKATVIPPIPGEDKAQLSSLFYQRQLAQETATRIQLEYEKTLTDLSAQYTQLTTELQKLVDKVYADAKVDKKALDLNLAKGEFQLPAPAPKPQE